MSAGDSQGSVFIACPGNAAGPRIARAKQPPFHDGIDIADPAGTPVQAAAAGRAAAGYDDLSGHSVYIKHEGLSSSYSHLSGINVAQAQQVAQSDVICWVRTNGRYTGPHLYLRINDASGTPID